MTMVYIALTITLDHTQGRCQEAGGCAGTRVQVRISAEYVCGGRYDKDNGVITSPLYPANYVNSEACIYDIV